MGTGDRNWYRKLGFGGRFLLLWALLFALATHDWKAREPGE